MSFRRSMATWALSAALGGGVLPAAVAQEAAPIVERVEILQNQYLQTETLLFYVSTKAGDRYDERRLKEDFRRLWETGFLDDLLLDVQDGPKGKVVRFVVRERKRIQIVDYRGSKALTTTNIEDRLKEKDAAIRIDSFYDPAKVRRAEQVIREMLEEKGRHFGTVKHDAKTVGGSGTQVSFVIDDGPKTKIKEIDFVGNAVFSDGKLRGAMKKAKQAGFWNLSWLSGKRTWTEEKWSGGPEDPRGDQGRLEAFYLNHGYVTATVGQPVISYVGETGGKKPTKWMKVTIPVTEGDQYRVGEVKFEGLTVFKEEAIRPLFKLKSGDVYKESRLQKAYEKLRDLYGSLGYFQWTGYTKRAPDAGRKVVDLVLSMEEDKRYYVGKIRFVGNDSTRDKVIRREVYMNEGDVFNTEALKLSIRRINQLGYFKPIEGAPELSQSDRAEDKLDVTFKVEEQNRNQFTFGAGVSGLEGTFVNASFSTANFLGLGETFQVSAQSGKRTKNYQVAITEPYFLDRPITAGFDVFKRRLRYETFGNVRGFTQDTEGLGLVFGFPLGRFTRMFTNYAYEVIDIEDLEGTDPTTGEPTTDPNPIFDPFFFGEEGRRRESRLSPSVVYNTVDNPWMPRDGWRLTLSAPVAGGPLGGTLDYFKPNVEAIVYLPHTRKTALGLRAEMAWLKPFGDTAVVDPETGRNKLPLYQRFFLGGETQIRGFNIRSVGPTQTVDEQTRAVGGNKFVLFNAEYYVDVGGPLRFLLFFDAGQAFLEGEGIDLKRLRTSTGAELRFVMPVLNVPFRLIYAVNPNRDAFQPRSTFKFAVGTTF
ncbi:MAG: outer membrane protein assembly factor BamA [Acidobacteria bacterium]|nr:outer membrane protein assembly factor BamA [Acidobacteriota bacterium]